MSTAIPKKKRSRRLHRPHDKDISLMLRVQMDDAIAFAKLIDRYRPKVFGRFCRLFANRQDAEDLTQEVFLRLYRARKRYRPSARFNTWLFHIAQNVARNAVRSRRRRPSARLTSLAEAEDQNIPLRSLRADVSDSPSRPLERRELAGIVRAAVSDLNDRQRRALELHQFHHHTYAQIAEHMDMTPKAAKSLLYRARNQLRSCLAKVVDTM